MTSQKLADSDIKMAGLQKVGTLTPITFEEASVQKYRYIDV
jgi:hypothetical protein